jgi:circadian clock protein KaiC
MDELGHRLLEAVAERGVKRLAIDGLSGFFESAVHPERVTRFFSCLVNELRRRGVTTVMTLETRDAVGSTVSTQYGVSGFIDNLVFLRFVADRGRTRRILSLIKVRDADFDPRLQEMAITSSGIRIAGAFEVEGDVIPTASPAQPDGPELSPPTYA